LAIGSKYLASLWKDINEASRGIASTKQLHHALYLKSNVYELNVDAETRSDNYGTRNAEHPIPRWDPASIL